MHTKNIPNNIRKIKTLTIFKEKNLEIRKIRRIFATEIRNE